MFLGVATIIHYYTYRNIIAVKHSQKSVSDLVQAQLEELEQTNLNFRKGCGGKQWRFYVGARGYRPPQNLAQDPQIFFQATG